YVQQQGHKVLIRQPIQTHARNARDQVPPEDDGSDARRVSWQGPDYKKDFIAVVKPGGGGRDYVNYSYTKDGSPLKLRLPTEPGDYELVYVQQQGHKVLIRESIKVHARKVLDQVELEKGVNRSGSDYKNLPMNGDGPEVCLEICRNDDRCRAFTWTAPGHQAKGGKCWLKNAIPGKSELDWATSGVVRP